jgi:hypothetical protein
LIGPKATPEEWKKFQALGARSKLGETWPDVKTAQQAARKLVRGA